MDKSPIDMVNFVANMILQFNFNNINIVVIISNKYKYIHIIINHKSVHFNFFYDKFLLTKIGNKGDNYKSY